jgi:hypothetical protein
MDLHANTFLTFGHLLTLGYLNRTLHKLTFKN